MLPLSRIFPKKDTLFFHVIRFLLNFLFSKLIATQGQKNNFSFRFYRYTAAYLILKLNPKFFRLIFSNGSTTSNLVITFLKPANKSIEPAEREIRLLKNVTTELGHHFTPNALLVGALYLQPYMLDPELNYFAQSTSDRELAPIYIYYIFCTQQFYVFSNEAKLHLDFSELAMHKMYCLLVTSCPDDREKLANFIKYYVQGSLPLMGGSDQLNYQRNKNRLLLEYLKIRQPNIFSLGKYKDHDPKILTRRIGFIRFSLADSAESEQVFATIKSPPAGTEVFIFVFDIDEQERKRVVDSHRCFKDNIIKLNIDDIAGSINVIREHRIDLLVNTSPLSGRFINEISAILSLRAARVQAMFIGDVVTTGIAEIDYLIISQVYSSESMQQQFSESLVYMRGLSGSIILQKGKNAFPSKLKYSMSNDSILFGSNAHVMKLSPDTLCAWAKILKIVKNSRIVLMPFPNVYSKMHLNDLRKSIANACKNVGVDADRIVISEASGRDAVCKKLQDCDIYLDTFPYSGSISIFDALSTEKPIVTLKGELFRSRLASGILEELELNSRMVASSTEEYIEIAVEQALNEDLRVMLSQRIRSNLELSLSNFKETSSVEFYRTVVALMR